MIPLKGPATLWGPSTLLWGSLRTPSEDPLIPLKGPQPPGGGPQRPAQGPRPPSGGPRTPPPPHSILLPQYMANYIYRFSQMLPIKQRIAFTSKTLLIEPSYHEELLFETKPRHLRSFTLHMLLLFFLYAMTYW